MASISVSGLTKRFVDSEPPAVRDLSFEVDQGELVAILGPSGCGKTTALRSIAGLEIPDSGEIRISGEIVFSASRGINLQPERRRLGMVFQSYAVWPHMTVLENVSYPLRIRRTPRREIEERAREALRMVALDAYAGRYPGQLSGGQQQRVALARALVGEPQALLFDEPLSNLDAKLREHMRFELLELQQRLHFTALYVTHDQEEAMMMASRILVMQHGVAEQLGTPRAIYDRPTTAFVADFLGSINFIPGEVVSRDYNGGLAIRCPLGVLHARQDEPATPLGAGASVVVGVRPHWVQMQAAASDNELTGSVKQVAFLGNRTTYILAFREDFELRAELSGEPTLNVGDAVSAVLPPERCYVYETSASHHPLGENGSERLVQSSSQKE